MIIETVPYPVKGNLRRICPVFSISSALIYISQSKSAEGVSPEWLAGTGRGALARPGQDLTYGQVSFDLPEATSDPPWHFS
ncbi:MAG: hypothetical protein ACR2PH_00925, partial [Desulfobulbia bacterium]